MEGTTESYERCEKPTENYHPQLYGACYYLATLCFGFPTHNATVCGSISPLSYFSDKVVINALYTTCPAINGRQAKLTISI